MLNFEKMQHDSQKLKKIKAFINKYTGRNIEETNRINFLSEEDGWKKYKKNNQKNYKQCFVY